MWLYITTLLPLCDPGMNHRQPFSRVASSRAIQNPISFMGSVCRNVESWWGTTAIAAWGCQLAYWHNVWNDLQCSDKSEKAATNDSVFWLDANDIVSYDITMYIHFLSAGTFFQLINFKLCYGIAKCLVLTFATNSWLLKNHTCGFLVTIHFIVMHCISNIC